MLKEAFTASPIHSHFNPSIPAIVEINASDYALGAVLSQVNDSGKHTIAFDSCKLLLAELNYEVHDKELLGIVCTPKFLLVIRTAGMNSFLSFISLLLTTQEGWPLYQIPCHVGTTCTQRGGWTSSARILKIS
ncbi:hypothetical protein O181_016441 [Austropuccinia psidii MF-1]|uniref:Reverse transcriptase/retrotransposon-derived protein RNase H-like domain-containing protein n=1 Tax=Austropuccinia psidii MF-1 TaxID=1389203 RepID=A0A9Q3GR17_9BASI|nr:hypothetical protein [Austropuccinia psidii MF-1]